MHFKVREGVQAWPFGSAWTPPFLVVWGDTPFKQREKWLRRSSTLGQAVLPDAWMKEATVVISGKVVDENDQALAGSVVQVRGNGLCWELETDEAGAWSMETTAGLSLECTARCKGYIAKQFSCDSAGDYVSQLKPDDIVITGRVIDAASGMALPGAGVVAQHGTVLQQCSALQDGTFQFCFQATPTMDPVLAAVLPGYSRHIHSPGALFGGSTVHVGDLPLQLAPATVRGSLCHARTGQALAGLKLAAVDEAQVLWEGASDEAGSFSAVLPPQASGRRFRMLLRRDCASLGHVSGVSRLLFFSQRRRFV